MEDENLTESEERIEREDHVDGEEAHRIGEFDDLRDMISGLRDDVQSLRDMIDERFNSTGDAIAALTEDGAIIREAGDGAEGDADAVLIDSIDYPSSFDVITPLDDLDLDL